MEHKRSIVMEVTMGRTDSSRELYSDEVERIIEMLREQDPVDRMRRKVFYLAYELGIIHGDSKEDRAINRHVLDTFLERNSYLHKPLAKYRKCELPKLVSQMEMILKHTRESKAKKSVANVLAELGMQVDKSK
jgi:hypothetical protein